MFFPGQDSSEARLIEDKLKRLKLVGEGEAALQVSYQYFVFYIMVCLSECLSVCLTGLVCLTVSIQADPAPTGCDLWSGWMAGSSL